VAVLALVLFVVAASADYTVEAGDTLAEIAQREGIALSDLVAANDIANPDLIMIGQVLVIPSQAGIAPAALHIVQPGETLAGIASQYGTTAAALAAANNLANPNLILIGTELVLPGSAPAAPAAAPVGGGSYHVVQAGETLEAIALRYGTTVAALAAANGITDPTVIYEGTRLQLSGQPFVATAVASPSLHTVAPGETLSGIAFLYGSTTESLAAANQLADPNLIAVGQSLSVPVSGWTCPVVGAGYFNDWGFPRSGGRAHEGTDLFTPRGTEVRAPVSGTIEYLSGRIGGLQFRLYGDDGHLYIGTHLDAVGPSGWVAAATVVGWVGDTGNARGSSPHLHFEIHPNGLGATNPSPTLQQYGC
jgi:LysM repeat protein